MWEISGWVAWLLAVAIFAWLLWDFFSVNMHHSESELLSSREGVDELFSSKPGE